MRLMYLAVCFVLILAGCAEQPFAPGADDVDEITAEEALAKNGATKTVEVMEWDANGAEFYLECLDETVVYFGVLDWEQTTIETPSGRVLVNGKVLYSQPYGFNSSGDHSWLLVHGTQTFHDNVAPTGDYKTHFSLHEWYENESGDRLLQVGTYGLHLDDEGMLKMEKFHGWCPGAPDTEFSFL